MSHFSDIRAHHLNTTNPFLNAAAEGNLETVAQLASSGASVDEMGGEHGQTPLLFAAGNGHLHIVDYLISHGASVNQRGSNGSTALCWAAYGGHLSIVEYLLNHDANIDLPSYYGTSPIMFSVIQGQPHVMMYLLEKGADPTLQNRDGMTVLHLAISAKQDQILDFFLKRNKTIMAETQPVSQDGMQLDASLPNPRAILYDKTEALFLAARKGSVKSCELLVDEGADITAVDRNGMTLLLCGLDSNKEDVALFFAKKLTELVQPTPCGLLPIPAISLPEWAKARTSEGKSNIILASQRGCLSVVKFLVETGMGSLDETTPNRSTPLLWAAYGGSHDVVKYLLEQGASIDECSDLGTTAPLFAAQEGKTEVLRLFASLGIPIFRKNRIGNTPLILALQNNHEDTAFFLLESGSSVNDVGDWGNSPLTITCSEKPSVNLVAALISAGAKLDYVNKGGCNALTCAATANHFWLVEYLCPLCKKDILRQSLDYLLASIRVCMSPSSRSTSSPSPSSASSSSSSSSSLSPVPYTPYYESKATLYKRISVYISYYIFWEKIRLIFLGGEDARSPFSLLPQEILKLVNQHVKQMVVEELTGEKYRTEEDRDCRRAITQHFHPSVQHELHQQQVQQY